MQQCIAPKLWSVGWAPTPPPLQVSTVAVKRRLKWSGICRHAERDPLGDESPACCEIRQAGRRHSGRYRTAYVVLGLTPLYAARPCDRRSTQQWINK